MKIAKIIKDKKGAALFTALIIIAIAATLATALFAYSSNSIMSASIKEETKQIEFLARSGIESAIKVWDSIANTKKLTSFPVYLKSNGTYRGSNSNTVALQLGEIGYYIVKVDPAPTGLPAGAPSDIVLFESTAYINGRSLTKKAYLTETMSGVIDASEWYDDNGFLITNKLSNITYTVASASDLFKASDEGFLWGSCDGHETNCTLDHILFFETPSNSTVLNVISDQKCMFFGRTIFFNMGIKCNMLEDKDVSMVVFSGADIIITGDVDLIINETGNGSISSVILRTHNEIDEYLYTVNGKKMGKVYFMGNVYLSQYFHGTEQWRKKVISSGEAYYFDGYTHNGLDLTKLAVDLYIEGGGNSGSLAIRAIYKQNIGDTYANASGFLNIINSGTESTPPVINTSRLIIWQN